MDKRFPVRVVVRALSICLMGMLLSPQGNADEGKCYTLVPRLNDQFPMCLELERNLNEFCGEQAMVCGLKVSPKYPKLSLPRWQELELSENMDLVESLVRGKMLAATRNSPRAFDLAWDRLRDQIRIYGATLARSTIDFLNAGRSERVYRVETGLCRELNFGSSVTDPKWTRAIENRPADKRFIKTGPIVYLARDAQILEKPEWRERAESGRSPYPGATFSGRVIDVFYYEGRAFNFNWDLSPWVQEISTSRHVPPEVEYAVFDATVCQFTHTTRGK